jgi:PKD repeat protein
VLLGPVAAPAGAATGAGVIFALAGGETRPLPPEALEREATGLVENEYLVRATAAEAGETFRRKGLPVEAALERIEIPSVGYLTIPRPNGTTAYLPGSWFLEPATFVGGEPAVFSVEGGSTHFVRPLLAADPGDANAEDNIATVAGRSLIVGLHEGEVVAVGVTPASASSAAGSPVQLSATASATQPAETFAYTWSFGDGTTATGPTVSHAFVGSGTYVVRVTATGSGGSGGESAPVNVVVGTPPEAHQPGATAATPQPETKRRRPAGPDGEGGQGRGGRGSRSGKGGSGDTEHVAREGKPRRRSGHGSSPDRSIPPASEPAPAVAPPLAASTTAGTEGGSHSGGPGSGAEASARQQANQPTSTAGQLVEGRLVGDDLGPTATLDEAAAGTSSGQGAPSAAGAAGGGAGAPVVALVVVGLLAAGALYEWRRGGAIR